MEGKEYVEPSYYAVIPSSVRYDNELKPNEKLLYGEITALCDKLGYCWATNDYFAKLYNVSRETVSRWVNHLIKKGYLFSQIIYKENSSEILNRVLKLDKNLNIDITNFYRKRDIFPIDDFVDSVLTKKSREYSQNNQESIDEKVKENNTSINNTSNNNQLEEDFEKLWKLYPRKEGKKKAFEAYKRAIKNGTTNKEIQTGIVNYLTQIRVQRTNKQYIKQGSTWFNGECWNDEYNVGQERSPVNPKTVPSSPPAERTVADLEREQRESRRDAFPMQYKNHPEWFNEETIKNILEEFPELREKVAEIDRARATSDSNTA